MVSLKSATLELELQRISVGMGEIALTTDPNTELVCLGLGSCIAVCAYAPRRHAAALAHVMLPSSNGRATDLPGKYADTVINHLLTEIGRFGVFPREVRFILCGGASIFPPTANSIDIGGRNLTSLRSEIQRVGLPIINECVGGRESRSVTLHVGRGECQIRTIRTADKHSCVYNVWSFA